MRRRLPCRPRWPRAPLLLEGAPGVGKSRLPGDFVAQREVGTALYVPALAGEAARPYAVLVRLLHRLWLDADAPCRRSLDTLPAWARREIAALVPALGEAVPRPEPLRLQQAVALALNGSGLRLVVVDDAQQADAATLELVPALQQAGTPHWWFAVRSGEMPPSLEAWAGQFVAAAPRRAAAAVGTGPGHVADRPRPARADPRDLGRGAAPPHRRAAAVRSRDVEKPARVAAKSAAAPAGADRRGVRRALLRAQIATACGEDATRALEDARAEVAGSHDRAAHAMVQAEATLLDGGADDPQRLLDAERMQRDCEQIALAVRLAWWRVDALRRRGETDVAAALARELLAQPAWPSLLLPCHWLTIAHAALQAAGDPGAKALAARARRAWQATRDDLGDLAGPPPLPLPLPPGAASLKTR